MLDAAGHAAITFEHSWGDGVAVLRVFNEVFEDSTRHHHVGPETVVDSKTDPQSEVKHLAFQMDGFCKNAAKEAREKLAKFTATLDLNFLKYNKMNRDYFKQKKLSPDSMFQLAFQSAFYKLNGIIPPTYEACSTAAFKHGRTETVRSATDFTKKAAEALAQKDKFTAPQIREILEACSKKHFELTKNAAMGQGCDRHLFALKNMAERRGGEVPAIFSDKSYSDGTHYVLSTSTLYGDYFSGGGFGPVVPDGFGVGYGYVDDLLGIFLSNFKPHRNGKDFIRAFEQSLDEIHQVLERC
jgi:carnitine O-palmitoyltransferase 2